MAMRFQFLMILPCALALAAGCERRAKAPELPPAPPRVAYATVSQERKIEFCNAVAEALKDFDDLYGRISVSVKPSPEGPELTVSCGAKAKPDQIERALGVALANFEFQAPGIRFVATGDSTWRILLPNEMQIAAEGKFNLCLP